METNLMNATFGVVQFNTKLQVEDVYINEIRQTTTPNQSVFDFAFTGKLENLAIRGTPGSFGAHTN